ncbi:hypothetical protein [Allobaculum sp. Allo2]|uniref:hypothetical protein n=1 Tax=Allobaculum sp. Allo2 TaxID=2853432 RepID=UPI001F60146A|nr:hypothetical protein [Allobaculum sp. Allo2]UNT92364.1 hypothetical protein KWG61_09230 [Allobaculum sp. Allo2]
MMKFKFSDSYGNDVTYEIHDSELGHALERMLPLTVILNQIGSSEMSFVPPKNSPHSALLLRRAALKASATMNRGTK